MLKYLSDDRQNCLQCCLAGLFELELDKVPGVHAWSKSHSYWYAGLDEWARSYLKHAPIAVVDDTLDGIFHIAVVEREGVEHAVIARGQEIVWDPTPTGTDTLLGDVTYSLVFIYLGGLSVQHAREMDYIKGLEEDYEHGFAGKSRE